MSKILLIGDWHLGMSYPNNYQKWLSVAKEYFDEFLYPLILKELTENDMVVQLGDLLDNRNLIPIDILNYAQYVVEKISKICPLHILVGNHDMFHKSSGEINSINLLGYIPNVTIYAKPTKIEHCGKSILMMPYIEKKVEQIEVLQKFGGCDYLFCHSDLNGARMHLTSVGHKNLDKIDIEDFVGFKNIKTGHIHIRQQIKNLTFVGSVYEMDRNDINNQKGIYILDLDSSEEIFFPNEISPKFKKVFITSEMDIESLQLLSTKDYIDLHISNSLLINNRKLRRKLEIMLESGNFASVDYIDDLVLENNLDNNKTPIDEITEDELNNGVIPSIQLEYTDLIRKYINTQKYESEKIKSGVLQEFNEIARIYEEGYLE